MGVAEGGKAGSFGMNEFFILLMRDVGEWLRSGGRGLRGGCDAWEGGVLEGRVRWEGEGVGCGVGGVRQVANTR